MLVRPFFLAEHDDVVLFMWTHTHMSRSYSDTACKLFTLAFTFAFAFTHALDCVFKMLQSKHLGGSWYQTIGHTCPPCIWYFQAPIKDAVWICVWLPPTRCQCNCANLL